MDMNAAVQKLNKYGTRIEFSADRGKYDQESLKRFLSFNNIGHAWKSSANKAASKEDFQALAISIAKAGCIAEASIEVTYRKEAGYWQKEKYTYYKERVGAVAVTMEEAVDMLYAWLETLQSPVEHTVNDFTFTLLNAPEKEYGGWN